MVSRLLSHVGYGLVWATGVTTAGALLGAIAFPIVGTLTGSEASLYTMAMSGMNNLGFLAFIWGPGIGVVMAFHRAYSKSGKKTHVGDPP